MYSVNTIKLTLSLSAVWCITLLLFLSLHTISTHAQTATPLPATSPDATTGLTIDQGEIVSGNVSSWFTGEYFDEESIFYSVSIVTPDSSFAGCVTIAESNATVTITAHSDSSKNACTSAVRVTADDFQGNRYDRDFPVTVRVAQDPLAFSASAPTEIDPAGQPTIDIVLRSDETRPIDLSEWHTGGTAPFTYVVLRWNLDPLSLTNIGGRKCIKFPVSDSTLTLSPEATLGSARSRCVDELRVSITDTNSNVIHRNFYVERNTSVPAPTSLVATGSAPDISFDRGIQANVQRIDEYFTGGTGTVTYSATSSNTSCVTTGAIAPASGNVYVLAITTIAGANACSSLITIRATDDADDSTADQTFTIYTPKLKRKAGTSIDRPRPHKRSRPNHNH